MNKLVSAMHDATHLAPGAPAHSDTPATAQRHGTRVNPRPHDHTPRVQNHTRHHQTPPRVLVAWQNWISRLVGRGSSQQR
jgi:hypothetical protein